MYDIKKVEKKWQELWKENHVFEPGVDEEKKKYFLTFPYPYINAYPHIGHLFTTMRVEAFARYKRLRGFNVLFPQAWHATGSPIVNAAKRVQEREPKQMKILADLGIPESEIPKFEKPEYWVEFFAPAFEKDYRSLGLSIDWRRTFYTTSLNPHYDKFIRWQFNKLREKGYCVQGKFPVVYCPKCQTAVGDHSRVEGEGETTQEFTLLKFKITNGAYKDAYMVAATLRPETVFGQTNLWVGPENEYLVVKVSEEIWILSDAAAAKLAEQDKTIERISQVNGSELVGLRVIAPYIHKEILVLPSGFCEPTIGTGIVTSVPSDAPDDWMGLVDLQNDPELCKRYGLDPDEIKSIRPISIINSEDLGDLPAVKVCQDMDIKSQKERDKLNKAKKLVYKKGFYQGRMKVPEYKDVPVEEAKELIKVKLIKSGEADIIYELTGKVVCRCLTPAIAKVVTDQWFLNYADPEWKKLAHECLDQMTLFPEKVRNQFEYVIDWLRAWACTHDEGLGTRLPWDKHWLIESLSDSTIYMAYYTIAHLITKVDPEHLDDAFFDYVFLEEGDVFQLKVDQKLAHRMKAAFRYWYPLDFRNSAKDLVQNHLTFCIFNHVAIFDKKHWPKAIGVNGYVAVDGQKMSKSLGNFITVRQAVEQYGSDAVRLTILNGGEGMDDPNWDSDFAKSLHSKFDQLLEFAKEYHDKGREDYTPIDQWFESELNCLIFQIQDAMEETNFRSAIQMIYFDFQRILKWYMRRTNNQPNRILITKFIQDQAIMLSCFIPHICEEIWEAIGKSGLISMTQWPSYEASKIDQGMQSNEDLVRKVMTDIKQVMRLAEIQHPSEITLFIAEDWKYVLIEKVASLLEETRDQNQIMKIVMEDEQLRQHGQQVIRFISKLLKSGSVDIPTMSSQKEYDYLFSSADFFQREFGCPVHIVMAKDFDEPKARNAMPQKPAILLK